MAELKRFIHTTSAKWATVTNKNTYDNSIVFIHDGDKGVSIYTQGATFDTELTAAEVEPMVKAYLEAGQNVTITETNGKLVIAAPGTTTITATSTELVQAQAVAGAFKDASASLIYDPTQEGASSYTFQQEFTKLDGTKSSKYPTIKITEGDNINLNATAGDGLVISATDTTYSAGTGLKLDGTTFNHTNNVEEVTEAGAQLEEEILSDSNRSFEVKAYTYDSEGHITGSVDNKVTLPAEAFKDTQYSVTMAAGNSGEVSLTTKKDNTVENTYTIKGDEGTTVSFDANTKVMTISSNTAETILSGLDVTDTAVANEYVSEVDQTNGKISVTRTTLPVYGVSEATVDGLKLSLTNGKVGLVDDGLAADLTSKNITVTKKGETGADSFVYEIKQGGVLVGTINHPSDMVVESGSVITLNDEKYLRLELANTDEHVDIAVKDLVDVYTAGNGIEISDANVVSAKVKSGETYLKVGADGLYTEGIGTAITTAIANLDGSATATENTTEGIVNVLTSVVEVDGIISRGAETAVATATYVDNAIAALDVASTTVGTENPATEGDTVTVIDQITYSENDGIVSISASTTTAATKSYVDSKAAAATTTVVKSTDAESVKYLDVTEGTVDGHKQYTVKVSGIDTAISTAINDLDSSVDVDEVTGGSSKVAHDGLIFEKIEETNGKLDASKTTVKYVDQSKLTNSSLTGIKYIGINKTDTISQAFEKCEAAWEWGTI